jgi:hypothetical protein
MQSNRASSGRRVRILLRTGNTDLPRAAFCAKIQWFRVTRVSCIWARAEGERRENLRAEERESNSRIRNQGMAEGTGGG